MFVLFKAGTPESGIRRQKLNIIHSTFKLYLAQILKLKK